jgi:ATP-binding cassette, subfamily B, multidrug efflux pump
MEQDKIVKGYDPVIMARILSYTKPFKGAISLALLAMLIATTAELLGPVILQKAVDQDIVVRYYRADQREVGTSSAYQRLEELSDSPAFLPSLFGSTIPPDFGPYHFFTAGRVEKLSSEDRQLLFETGILDRNEWYLTWVEVDAPQDGTAAATLAQLRSQVPELLVHSEEKSWIALPAQRLDELQGELLSYLRSQDLKGLADKSLIYLILLTGMLLFSFLQVYLMAYSGQGVMRDLRASLYSHVVKQDLGHLGNIPVGTLVTRVTNDVETINELFTSVATGLLKDIATMIGVIIILFFLDTKLALITSLSLPPVFILTIFFRKLARDAYRRVRMWTSRVNAFLSEHISGMDVVQSFRREEESCRRFKKRNGELLSASLAEMYVFATFRPLISLLTSVSIGTVLYFGGRMILDSAVSLGVLIAFVNLMQMFYRPVMNFTENFTILQSAMAGGERIFQLLDENYTIEDGGTTALPEPLQGKIEFKDVCFSYKPGEPVLRNLSFTIEPGESIAIVGYTGAGKTTIASLLTRLWDIESGSILLDGRDIREYPLQELRSAVVPVQQDVFLFADTIRENIALGKELFDEEIASAARTVQAAGFIETLPKGYDTVLTERGTNFSTGQRQLISFSRVVAQDPRVIILDEATGSIDTETEKLIQQAMTTLMQGRTSIVIAHRLSTIQHADRILVLSGGKLVESGNHEALLKKEGIYANLYRLQYRVQ